MATIELERMLVKSAPELWEEIASERGLPRWLGEVEVKSAEAPSRLEWDSGRASGVIELEPSGWGTKIRAQLEGDARVEQRLGELLDDLAEGSLKSG